MGYSIPTGLVLILYGTVGFRLRLFTFIPGGDEMLLSDQDLWVKSSPLEEGQGEKKRQKVKIILI